MSFSNLLRSRTPLRSFARSLAPELMGKRFCLWNERVNFMQSQPIVQRWVDHQFMKNHDIMSSVNWKASKMNPRPSTRGSVCLSVHPSVRLSITPSRISRISRKSPRTRQREGTMNGRQRRQVDYDDDKKVILAAKTTITTSMTTATAMITTTKTKRQRQ